MWTDTTCSSHKTRIPMAGWCGVMDEAGQTSWDAQLGPCSAQCQPRMVTVPVVPPAWWHIHSKAVSWVLPPKASHEPWARLNKQIQPNLSFQRGNFPLLPCQSSSWGCDPLIAVDGRGENLAWRRRCRTETYWVWALLPGAGHQIDFGCPHAGISSALDLLPVQPFSACSQGLT